jgi:hypothetical protein
MQQKDIVKIIVNAQERIVPFNQLSVTGEISYEKLITLAFDAGYLPAKQDLMFTITYRDGAGRPADGTLMEGESTKIQNGTVFNVTATDRS